jgi:protein-arginine kinase activator protein McsA
MPEKKVQVDTFLEKYVCDTCGEGEMESLNIQLISNPPKIKHVCNACGHFDYYERSYPNYKFVERKPQAVRKPAGKGKS